MLQVVLPDRHKPDNDHVLFLPLEMAQPTSEAAEQAAAVCALHDIAGARAMHRILPPAFRPMWEELGIMAAERTKVAGRTQGLILCLPARM